MENFVSANFEKMDLLLSSKSFGELSETEREFVCKNISREEYDDLFCFYQNISQAKTNIVIEPKPEIKAVLNKQFVDSKSSNPFLSRKLSMLKVAAVAAACFVLGFGISSLNNTTKYQPENLTDSIIRDTMQVIKYIQLPKQEFFAQAKASKKSKVHNINFATLPENYYHEKDAILLASQTKKIENPVTIMYSGK